jgi:DNA-binding MarR family transcriptional regulator
MEGDETFDKTINRENELWLLLRQANNLIYKAIERELRQLGSSTYAQATVMWIVKAIGDEATPAEISRWLVREPHAMSMLLSQMEGQGLVRKTKDLEKKNMVRISLTEKGEEALHRAQRSETISRVMSCFSYEEQDCLRGYLLTLRSKVLEELGVEHEMALP